MAGLDITRQILSFPGLFGLDSLAVDECFPLLQLFNDDVARLSREYPEQFSGLATLPMADMDVAVDEYKRARNDLGLIGAILPNNAFLSASHAARLAPIFAVAQDIGGHLFIHPGRRPDEVLAAYTPVASPVLDHAMARQALHLQNNVAQCMVTLVFGDFLDPYPDVSLHVANLGGTLPMVIERMDNVVRTRMPEAALPSSKATRAHVDCSSLGPRALEIAVAMYGADGSCSAPIARFFQRRPHRQLSPTRISVRKTERRAVVAMRKNCYARICKPPLLAPMGRV